MAAPGFVMACGPPCRDMRRLACMSLSQASQSGIALQRASARGQLVFSAKTCYRSPVIPVLRPSRASRLERGVLMVPRHRAHWRFCRRTVDLPATSR